MAQKSFIFSIISLSTVVLAPVSVVVAEFVCSAEVSYKWSKSTSDGARNGKAALPSPAVTAAGSAAKEKQEKPSQEGAVGSTAPLSSVRFAGVERSGVDEAAAKQALQLEVNRQKARASEACHRDHEAFSACAATKLSVQSSLLNSLSFSARQEIEKGVIAECREQQGSCITVESSEPQCREVVAVVEAPAAGGKGDAKKGDAKKK